MYLTGNPGGSGHSWVKRLFVDRDFAANEDPGEYSFIQARVYDNTVLMDKDPDYVKGLESIPDEKLRRAWLLGDWNVLEGQYFSRLRGATVPLTTDSTEPLVSGLRCRTRRPSLYTASTLPQISRSTRRAGELLPWRATMKESIVPLHRTICGRDRRRPGGARRIFSRKME